MGPVNADEVQLQLHGSSSLVWASPERGEKWGAGATPAEQRSSSPGPRRETASGSGTMWTSPDWLIPLNLDSAWDFPPSPASEQLSSGMADPWGGQRYGISPYLAVRRLFSWINAWQVSLGSSPGR